MANDGNTVQPEPQIEGNPTPKISGKPDGQSLSQVGGQSVDLSAIINSPELQDFIRKEVQSKQDSRLGKYDTRLEKLENTQEATIAKYEALLGSGMSKEQAIDRMKLDQKLSDLEQAVKGDAPSQPSAGTEAKPWTERQATLLEQAGIAKDDRRLTDMLKDNTFASHEEYLKVLEEKTFEWKQADAKKPQPSSSTVAQTVPGVTPSDGDYKDVSSDDLGERVINLSREYSKNKGEIDRIEKELARRDKME